MHQSVVSTGNDLSTVIRKSETIEFDDEDEDEDEQLTRHKSILRKDLVKKKPTYPDNRFTTHTALLEFSSDSHSSLSSKEGDLVSDSSLDGDDQ